MIMTVMIRYRSIILLLLLVLVSDMVFRTWQPVSTLAQSSALEAPMPLVPATAVPAEILQYYQSVQPQTDTEDSQTEQLPLDAKQIGSYVIELFGIYSQNGQHKAILRIKPDADSGKRLRRVGLGPLNSELELKTLTAESLTVVSAGQSITLQLFNKKQLKQAAE